MDREELTELLRHGPVRIWMNDGQSYDIPSAELALVDSMHVHVMSKREDGQFRTRIHSLLCICSAESLAQPQN